MMFLLEGKNISNFVHKQLPLLQTLVSRNSNLNCKHVCDNGDWANETLRLKEHDHHKY